MSKTFRALGRILANLIKGKRLDTTPYPMRRPVDELLDCSYKFAHGPYSIKDIAAQSKDAA